jgi:hypothetical protein
VNRYIKTDLSKARAADDSIDVALKLTPPLREDETVLFNILLVHTRARSYKERTHSQPIFQDS